MRKFRRSLLGIGTVLTALLCAAVAFLITRLPAFGRGERYEISHAAGSSSAIVETDTPFLEKLTARTAGESVRYTGDRYLELKEKFRASLLFYEEVCGIASYYLYSPFLGAPVVLNGYRVNLHIAVGAGSTAVGTPVIFGGY